MAESAAWAPATLAAVVAAAVVLALRTSRGKPPKASPLALPTESETWRAFLTVGVLFPAHVLLGVVSLPLLVWHLMHLNGTAFIVAALYAPFYFQRPERRWPGGKGFPLLWRLMDYDRTCRSYFGQFGVHGGENVERAQQYIVASHPHGTVIFQRMFWRSARLEGLFGRDWRMVKLAGPPASSAAVPALRPTPPTVSLSNRQVGARVLFSIPVLREFSTWFGAIDAGKPTCEAVLRAGANLVVYPGGLDEANGVDSTGSDAVTLRTRTGFIRLAISHQVPVLPTFCFGELDAVQAVRPIPAGLAGWLRRKFRFSSNVFVGRFGLPIPRRVPFNLCIGEPIRPDANIREAGRGLEAEVWPACARGLRAPLSPCLCDARPPRLNAGGPSPRAVQGRAAAPVLREPSALRLRGPRTRLRVRAGECW